MFSGVYYSSEVRKSKIYKILRFRNMYQHFDTEIGIQADRQTGRVSIKLENDFLHILDIFKHE